jgi:hypothetical protein
MTKRHKAITLFWFANSITSGMLGIILPAIAQANQKETASSTTVAQISDKEADISTKAEDLRILPRLGVGYSTSGDDSEFTSIEGFVPLIQDSGNSLTYLQGKLLFDDRDSTSSSFILGHRYYNGESDRIIGGYVGYSTRDTGKNIFGQFNLGFESLGKWDFRTNAYLPVGDRRKSSGESVFDAGSVVSNLGFAGNNLSVETTRSNLIFRNFESALAGLDVEGGVKLASIGSKGDIRGYIGGYYYDVPQADDVLGWKTRLEIRPTDYLNLGLSLQNDNLFGTNVLFTVGANFPGTRPRNTQAQDIIARLGEPVARQANIPVLRKVTREVINTKSTTVATNPQTGKPYVFQQVNLDGSAGTGTEAQPFNKVQDAINATQSDGNSIVYVQGNQIIPGFTIPDRVQVLSTGPVQQLLTQEFGLVTLPRSNSGNFPQITDRVQLGNNTVLSGFGVAGIDGKNVTGALVRDNFVTSTNQAALALDGTGLITLRNNIFTGEGVPAFLGTNVNTVQIENTAFRSNNSTSDGISLNGVSGTVDFGNNLIKINNPSGTGIYLENIAGRVNINTPITIDNPGIDGIAIVDSTGIEFSRSAININNPGEAGIYLDNVSEVKFTNAAITVNNPDVNGIAVVDSSGVEFNESAIAINNPGEDGIYLENVNGININAVNGSKISNAGEAGVYITESTGNLRIAGLEIDNAGNGGIVGEELTGTLTLENNKITSAQNQGIRLQDSSGIFNIIGNTISDTKNSITASFEEVFLPEGEGILLENVTGTANISQNTITETQGSLGEFDFGILPSGQGIVVDNDTGNINLNVDKNTISNNFQDGILIGLGTLGAGNATATISLTGNTIENNGDRVSTQLAQGIGIGIENQAVVNLTISGNTIKNNANDGVDIRLGFSDFFFNTTNSTAKLENATISNNIIENNGQAGIKLEAFGATTIANASISNNPSIKGNGDAGIQVKLGTTDSSAKLENLTISGNTIENNGQTGIKLEAEGKTRVTNAIINRNTLRNNAQEGVLVVSTNAADINTTINNNTLVGQQTSENVIQGINIAAVNSSKITAEVQSNTVTSNNTTPGVEVKAVSEPSTVCLNLANNISNSTYQLNSGADDIFGVFAVLGLDINNFDSFVNGNVGDVLFNPGNFSDQCIPSNPSEEIPQ